jgi:hypothetical protein
MSPSEQVAIYEDLLKPPPKRASGIKADYWVAAIILGFFGLVVLSIPLASAIYALTGGEGYDARFEQTFGCISIGLATAILAAGIYGLSPQWRSVRYSRRKHRVVWDAIKRLADRERGELHIEFMPELTVEDRTLFVASYRHRLDRQALIPIATLLFDDQGRVIENDAVFEKAYTTYNFGLFTTGKAQGMLDEWQRQNRKLLKRKLPGAREAIERNQSGFEAVGAGNHSKQAIEGLSDFEEAMREVDRFLEARQGYVKAVGYGHHPVYLYEDADRFERLSVAFAKKLESAYGQRLQDLSLAGEFLLREFEQHPGGWRNRKQLERALKLLAGSRLAIQKWIDDFGNEARVPEPSWKNYHEKLRTVRSQGVPVYTG